ncbi:hypothetical protein R3P38DRAFT_3289923 [Favolaschia claudopus]|uniref:DUF6589 domain-containing protein n=1 Tax=Favolaschia claudopus TaxID=2862362 RepID=A0AAV9ZTW3_9AGAR
MFSTLADRYASQGAINASLSEEETTDPERVNQIPVGRSWTAPTDTSAPPPPSITHPTDTNADDEEMPGLVEIDTEPATPRARTVPLKESDDDAPKVHKEKSGFTGDRVLRNSQIFMQDFGWWIEFAHAVPEGDIGRVWEIMKIWIFKFAGSSHHNYVNYLLEVYCMLRYEASKDLRNAILNNWLLNIKGELGHWIPGDLHQEHYIKWLKEMIRRHGGEFDDPFYRKTISPNVHHFIQIKEEVEAAFDLERRSQKHTSPHQRDELKLLLRTFKEEEVHVFRSKRSLGHAAVNQFARGCKRLEKDKLKAFLEKSTVLGDFVDEIRRRGEDDTDDNLDSDSGFPEISGSQRPPSSASSQSSAGNTDNDPNEPEEDDDDEDLSNEDLTSDRNPTSMIDEVTGLLVSNAEGDQKEDESEEEEEDDESESEDEPEEEEEVENDG